MSNFNVTVIHILILEYSDGRCINTMEIPLIPLLKKEKKKKAELLEANRLAVFTLLILCPTPLFDVFLAAPVAVCELR